MGWHCAKEFESANFVGSMRSIGAISTEMQERIGFGG